MDISSRFSFNLTTLFFTIRREKRISAKFLFFCRKGNFFFVGIYLTKEKCGGSYTFSVHEAVFNGIMGQFRIVLHVHLFENAGPVGADRFYT